MWTCLVGIRCVDLGHVASNCTLHVASATLFLSFVVYVPRCCHSAVDFTGKKVVSVVAMFKIEVAIDFYVTISKVSTSWGVCRLQVGCSRRAPSPRYGCRRLLASSCGIKLSIRSCRSNSVSFYFTQTFLEKVLLVFNHAMLKSRALFNVRNRASRRPDCMLDRQSNDESGSAIPPRPAATRRSLADRCARRQFSVDSQLVLQSQASETHVALFCPRWKRKPFLIFVFRIWSRRMFIWSQ